LGLAERGSVGVSVVIIGISFTSLATGANDFLRNLVKFRAT
jgi:hypothetical protein